MEKRLVIIDLMSLVYKAYFAFSSRPLRNKKGEVTSAVYGFITQLLKIMEVIKPEYLIVAKDHKDKTLRHDKFADYKANRAAMPEDMIPQLGRIDELLEICGIPALMLSGYEADDIVGTLAKKYGKEGYDVYMVSPDKDYVQLVDDNVRLYRPGRQGDEFELLDVKRVIEKYGFEPSRMIDYLALLGDSSDNIPGVNGIGEKSALPLIVAYGTIENIYQNLGDVTEKGKIRQKLEANREMAFLSKELATIHTEVPVEFDPEKAVLTPPDTERLSMFFTEMEFRSLYPKFMQIFGREGDFAKTLSAAQSGDKSEFKADKVKYHLIRDTAAAESLAKLLSEQKEFVFDTETDSLDVFMAELAGVSFCFNEGEAYFAALNTEPAGDSLFSKVISDRIPLSDFIRIFKPVMENQGIKKICHNGKYDIAIMRSKGINVGGFWFDTMVASYCIDPDQRHNMDDVSRKYLNYSPIPLSSLIGEKKDPSKIFDVPLEKLSDYSAEDADVTFRLYKLLSERLKNDKLERLAYEVEFPLIEVLEAMEREGIRIDKDILHSLSRELDVFMTEMTRNIFIEAGEEFNINSPVQLQRILFEKLNLSTGKKTKTGFSTDAQTLESLRNEHPVVEMILNYRQASKLKSTYADALPQLIRPETGRVHTSFNQTVASTGRLSSIEPNLQNIPIRTELGKEIRKAFVPRDKNHTILSMDYSQIELRIMASICGDPALIEAFRNGEDIHKSTAALVFMVKPEEVTPDMRRKAKEVNFGILYGIGAFGLKTRLGITQTHAKEIIDTYFNTFKNVKAYMDSSVENARSKGYAETLTGRRRYLLNINSKNFAVRQFEERAAINMPIQGTAADMIKLAMIKIYRYLSDGGFRTKMVLQVHDELLFDAHREELETLTPVLKKLMEGALPLEVPVVVDSGSGENWLDAH